MLSKKIIAAAVSFTTLWSSTYAIANVGTMQIATNPHSFSESILSHGSHSSPELRGQINSALADESLAGEFAKAGINRDEAKMRLAGMTDQELQQIKMNADRQAGGAVIVIGTGLLIIILILVLLLR